LFNFCPRPKLGIMTGNSRYKSNLPVRKHSYPIREPVIRLRKSLRGNRIFAGITNGRPMMETMSATGERRCEECGKVLRGRSDKRFCNDGCRNNFNRKRRQVLIDQVPQNYREIFKVIKSNYLILCEYYPSAYKEEAIYREELENRGFNFKFLTSIHYVGDLTWRCCSHDIC